jgi:hypothetical protein
MGEPILSYTSRIPDPVASELIPYIKKLLSTGQVLYYDQLLSQMNENILRCHAFRDENLKENTGSEALKDLRLWI